MWLQRKLWNYLSLPSPLSITFSWPFREGISWEESFNKESQGWGLFGWELSRLGFLRGDFRGGTYPGENCVVMHLICMFLEFLVVASSKWRLLNDYHFPAFLLMVFLTFRLEQDLDPFSEFTLLTKQIILMVISRTKGLLCVEIILKSSMNCLSSQR